METGAQFWVGDWRVDPASGRIQRDDRVSKLEPRVMDVLVYLAQHPGEVVQREELENHVWSGVVVGYDALSHSVGKLRKAFDDNPRDPKIIETVSKRGYRLIAPVSSENPQPPTPRPQPERSRPSGNWFRKRWFVAVLLIALLPAVLLLSRMLLTDHQESRSPRKETTDTGGKPSIVVLPFRNLDDQTDSNYFSDGITEDLIVDLSKLSGLFVISPSSSFYYRDRRTNIKSIAEELKVQYVIEGSVRRLGKRVRITAQLTDTRTGYPIWSERFDRELRNVFDLQDEVNRQIVTALKIKVTEGERVTLYRRYTRSLPAYDLFRRGLVHFGRRTAMDNAEARRLYQQAIHIDPGFARAYATLANTHRLDFLNGWSNHPEDSLRLARELAEKALSLDELIPQIHFVMGLVYREQKAYARAASQAFRALELDPNYADARVLLASNLCYSGKPKKGLAELKAAKKRNPHYPSNYPYHMGVCHFTQGQYRQAIDHLSEGVELNPNSQHLHMWLAASYALDGQTDEANWAASQLTILQPTFSVRRIAGSVPYKHKENLDRLLSGLLKAGLPD